MASVTDLSPKILLLQTCAEFQQVRQLHAQFVVSGLIKHKQIVPRKLIQAYVRTSHVDPAISIFQTSSILSPDLFMYNTIIRGHQPDNYTYTFVLKACSRLHSLYHVGKQVHSSIIKVGVPPHTYVHSSLITMYASAGCMDDAERVFGEFDKENVDVTNSIISGYCRCGLVAEARAKFDGIKGKDVASWSAMITGYIRNQMHMEALSLFRQMTVIDPQSHLPNESMLVSLLSACGCLRALPQGRWIHKYIDRFGIKKTTNLYTAIIDMYAKCGSIECSYDVFRKMDPRDRDIVSWGAMISGFAIHGQANKCSELFDEMIANGIRPNAVVFVAVLMACSHSGLVEKGQQYFEDMVHRFKITPRIEHYGCMVDMLARVGRLEEAKQIIESMPEKANSIILGAFLSGCRVHNDIERGSWAFQRLIEIEPVSGDRYKMGEAMYASAGMKKEATNIRRSIDASEMETTTGCSFIEVDGAVNEFIAGDIKHSKAQEIYRLFVL
ncbi:Putative pentatricopeptide repeat-containing protein At5g40405 [Linum perenne]